MAKSFNLTAQINLQGPTNIKPIVADIRRQLGNINTNINIKFDAKAAKGVDVLSQKMANLNKIILEVTKNSQILASSLNGVGSAVKGLGKINKVNTSLAQTSRSMVSTVKATKQAVSELEQFGKQAALAIRRFAAFSVVTTGVLSLVNAIRTGAAAFVEFDKQLIRLQQVTGSGTVGIKALQNEITSLAVNLGVSSESLTEVAVTLAQAGFSARETQQALAALAKTELAPSFDNLTDTTEGAIAAIRQFGIETKDLESVLGSINAVAAAFAVESSDIITAIQRAGGAFAASSKGVSEGADALNEFIAIFTSVRATTRESAETIATGLRTIFTRIQRGSTIDFLREFGVELTDIEGKFVGPYEAIKRLSSVLNTLDPRDLRFSQIVEELGGFRQISKVIPLIQQFSEAQKALAVAQKGQGSLSQAQVTAQKSLANQIAKVREEFLALIRAIGQSQTFQGLFKIVLGLTSGLIKLTSVFKPILPLLAVLGAVKGGQAVTKIAGGFIKGFRSGGGSGGAATTTPIGPSSPTTGGGASSTASNATQLADNTKSLVANTTSLDALTAVQTASASAFANVTTSMKDLQNSLSSLTGLGDVVRSSADHVYDTMIGLTVAVRDLNNTIIQKNSGGDAAQGFARGGLVPGKGNRDTVPAMLTPGEFVIRKKAVETLGAGNLQKMNKYAAGGPVEISEFEQLRDGTSTVKSSYSNRIQPQDQVKGDINRLKVNFNDKNFPIDWEQLVKDTDLKYSELKKKSPEDTDTYRLLNQASSLAFEQAVQQIIGGKTTDLSYPVDIIRPKKDPVEVKFTKDPVSIKELLSKLYRYRAVRKSLGRYPFTPDIDDNPPINIGKLDVVEMGPGQKELYNSWYAENKDKILNKYLGGKIQKFAVGGKALGARPTVRELDETELAQLSTAQLIKYANDLAYDVLTTGGAGMAIGSEFIEVPKEKIIPELESSLVSYMGKRGFWRETIAPFGRAVEQKAMDQSKLGREAALESQVSKYADEVAARAQEWTSIKSGSSIDNYLMQSLQEPILSDYKSSKAGQPLAKTFHATRLRQAVNKALDEFDDFDYSGSNIDKLVSGMAAKRFAKGGSTQDIVPALLTPGEFVINKKAAQKIGYSKLHSLNKADKLQGYNKGGIVGAIQKFAAGGDIRQSQEWADIVKQMSNIAGASANMASFITGLQDLEDNLKLAGKFDIAGQVKLISESLSAGDGDSLINNLTSSQSGRESLTASRSAGLSAEESLNRLSDVLNKNIKAQELFALSAEQAGISVKEFEQNIKTQILERSLSGEAGRKTSRLDLRKEFVKTRLRFNPNDLRDADNQQKARESLQTSLAGLLDPSELNDALDEIIYGLGTGAKSLEEIAAVSPEVAKALDAARDRAESMSKAHKELEDELGGLTDAVRISAEELAAFDYKKSGQAQKDFGLVGNINPSAALGFKNSAIGSRLLGASQNFMKTGGLGKLPVIGGSIEKLGGALENLPGPIGQAVKAIGGLPGAFAVVTSIIGSEFIPMLLKAAGAADSEIGAGVGGALAEGGSRAASYGALGNQVLGPLGAVIGIITGALSGAIDGFIKGLQTKKLENSVARLDKSIETLDKAFQNLAEKDNIQNVIAAQKSLKDLDVNITDLQKQAAVTPGEVAGSAVSSGIIGAGATTGLAALAILAGLPTGGFGTAAVLGGAAVIGGVGGAAYGTAKGMAPSELDNEALQASLKGAEKYVEGLMKLAERDIKLKSLSQLEDIINPINAINKDLSENRITAAKAEQLKKQEFLNLGSAASEQEAYNAGLAKISRQFNGNLTLIRKEIADRSKVIALGREEIGMNRYQMASTEIMIRLTKDMAKETEALVEAYNRALAGITRFKDEISNFVNQANQSAALLTGEGGMGSVNRSQEQMLRNITAYTADELKPVLETVGNLAGGGEQGQKLTDSIRASQIVQSVLPGILRNIGPADARSVGAVTSQLDAALAQAGIGETVRDALRKELTTYLEKETSNRSGDSFQELLANFPALQDAIDTTRKAQEVGIAILEAQNDALEAVNNQLDQYNKYLKQSIQWSIKADSIRLEGALALDRVLGKNISLDRLNAPITNEIKRLTEALPGGATTDPVAIAEGIRANEARIRQITGNGVTDRGELGTALDKKQEEAVNNLLKEQADLTRASNDAYEALEKLASNGEIAANILGKIEDERQLGKNFIDFARRVSTQTSEDSINMQRSFIALERAFDGTLNFGNRQERQLAFEGLDTLLPLIRGTEEGNQILRRVTENMLAAQGVNLDDQFGNTGSTIRELIAKGTTGDDPQTTELITLYRKALDHQATAATELAKLNGQAANKYLATTATIITNLYNRLPSIIASALADPNQQPVPEVTPFEVFNAGVGAVPAPIANIPAPAAAAQAQANNQQQGGQNRMPDVNFAVFDALSLSIKNLDLTLLNLVNGSLLKLTTSIDSLSTKFGEGTDMEIFGRSFTNSTELFGNKIDIFARSTTDFGSYVDKLSGAIEGLSNAKITMGGNYTVDVKVSGAAAFQAIEESTQKLIDKQIGLAMDDLNKKIADATGMSIDLRRRKA